MNPMIRRINARYRGPMESQKHDTFYRSLQDALNDLKQVYLDLESQIEPIKKETLSREHSKDIKICRLNPTQVRHGLGVTYPYSGSFEGIQRVGVLEKALKQNGGFYFTPKEGVERHAQRILFLDEIATGTDEFLVPATQTPLDVAISIQSTKSDLRKESLL